MGYIDIKPHTLNPNMAKVVYCAGGSVAPKIQLGLLTYYSTTQLVTITPAGLGNIYMNVHTFNVAFPTSAKLAQFLYNIYLQANEGVI